MTQTGYIDIDVLDGDEEARLAVTPRVVADLTRHAVAGMPDEVCGLVEFRDEVSVSYHPGENVHEEPGWRFELQIDPAIWMLDYEPGCELGVFHSHPLSSPVPSAFDAEGIGLYAGRPYLILSVGGEMELTLWRISADGEARSDPLALLVSE